MGLFPQTKSTPLFPVCLYLSATLTGHLLNFWSKLISDVTGILLANIWNLKALFTLMNVQIMFADGKQIFTFQYDILAVQSLTNSVKISVGLLL